MESKQVLLIISMVVMVSGCSQLPMSGNQGTTLEPEQVSGKGLEVTEFRVSDKTLSPGQTINVEMTLKNYHRNDIDIGNITLYNLGLLESSSKSCTPNEIGQAKADIYPVMECTWEVTAPSEEQIGGFSQRKSTISASIPYDSVIENYEPMTVKFKPLEEINRTSKQAMSFSNGEVGVNMEVETPVPIGQNKSINFKVDKRGSGSLDGNYSFEYSPSSVFVLEDEVAGNNDFECPSNGDPLIRDSFEFSCYIGTESPQEVERNLFFTVRYKYVKAPSIDVTLVNNQ